MIIALTGVCGFIGRRVAEDLLRAGHWVYGIDAETYAADVDVPAYLANLKLYSYPYGVLVGPIETRPAGNFKYIKADIAELKHLPDVDMVINFAAETHVDNSITDPARFIHSNVMGTHNLLELVRAKRAYTMPHFVQISTDEVYGSISPLKQSDENDALNPSSPYAASKASADLLVQAYHKTFDVQYTIIRPSNCYGPHQYPEKLIPKAVRHLKMHKKIPVHGDGSMIRSWVHVNDLSQAILDIIDAKKPNMIWTVPGELMDVGNVIKGLYAVPTDGNDYYEQCCEFDYVRKGIDEHYDVAGKRLRNLGWTRTHNLTDEFKSLYNHFAASTRF